jgi:hypothetical protein
MENFSRNDFKFAELAEVPVEGHGSFKVQAAHHDKRKRIAQRIRFVAMKL